MRPSSVLWRIPFLFPSLEKSLSCFPPYDVPVFFGCPCSRRYSSCSTHISFLLRVSNLIGGTPENTFAASLDNVYHPLIMRKFILRCTAPIRLSTKYAGMQSAQVDAPYSWIYSTTAASYCLRAGHCPPTLGISRITDVQAIDAFVAACFTWCLNDHLLSSHTPKYFISCLRGIISPLISIRGASYFLRHVTKFASHLLTVRCKNLLISQSAISSRGSLAIISTNHALSVITSMVKSSANPNMNDAPFASFILNSPSYMQVHKKGPFIDPCCIHK